MIRLTQLAILLVFLVSCGSDRNKGSDAQDDSHAQMVRLLATIASEDASMNPYYGNVRVRRLESQLANAPPDEDPMKVAPMLASLGVAQMDQGELVKSIANLTKAYETFKRISGPGRTVGELAFALGVANFRLGETENSVSRRVAAGSILPFEDEGIHRVKQGAEAAVRFFTEAAQTGQMTKPMKLRSLWFLNLTAKSLGEYPDKVPEALRLPEKMFESRIAVPRLQNVAGELGLDVDGLAGGLVIEDLDGDHDLDVLVSSCKASAPMSYFENLGKEGFLDASKQSGLSEILGGSNLISADYDNDGDVDVFASRGGWLWQRGQWPNSLLQNQGDGTFRDVTFSSGLGNVHYPSQTAAWGDYDNDGDLDLFVGNEHGDRQLNLTGGLIGPSQQGDASAPCQLFRNEGDGTFTDVADAAGVTNLRLTKGCVWGDVNGDRWPDLIVSNFMGPNRLYQNQQDGTFTDVALIAGIEEPYASFPVWVWDFNNDGALDIFIASFDGNTDTYLLGAMGKPSGISSGHYLGNGAGTFKNVAEAHGLSGSMLTMGANFGDINNDGFLDFYVGTGQPDVSMVVPNRFFLNQHGKRFHDVTMASGMGHLQKGNAIAFADLDQDGDQDIYQQMGGFKRVDQHHNVLYANRGGTDNSWIKVKLVGKVSNRSAIGARIKVTILEGGVERSIYRQVTSGGSFGAGPLRQHIGLGSATEVTALEVYWPTSDTTQAFEKVPMNQCLKITEDDDKSLELVDLEAFPFVENL